MEPVIFVIFKKGGVHQNEALHNALDVSSTWSTLGCKHNSLESTEGSQKYHSALTFSLPWAIVLI